MTVTERLRLIFCMIFRWARFQCRRFYSSTPSRVRVEFGPATVVQGMFYISFTGMISVSTDQKGIWEMCAPLAYLQIGSGCEVSVHCWETKINLNHRSILCKAVLSNSAALPTIDQPSAAVKCGFGQGLWRKMRTNGLVSKAKQKRCRPAKDGLLDGVLRFWSGQNETEGG